MFQRGAEIIQNDNGQLNVGPNPNLNLNLNFNPNLRLARRGACVGKRSKNSSPNIIFIGVKMIYMVVCLDVFV